MQENVREGDRATVDGFIRGRDGNAVDLRGARATTGRPNCRPSLLTACRSCRRLPPGRMRCAPRSRCALRRCRSRGIVTYGFAASASVSGSSPMLILPAAATAHTAADPLAPTAHDREADRAERTADRLGDHEVLVRRPRAARSRRPAGAADAPRRAAARSQPHAARAAGRAYAGVPPAAPRRACAHRNAARPWGRPASARLRQA